jgi:hypothetical protein
MGLDMYLNKKTYVQNWEHHTPEERYDVEITRGGKPVKHIQPKRVKYIVEEAGYWRKANHIHKWFVDNVQDGNDNCGEYYVEVSDLINLLEVCKQVKEDPSKADELLPTTEGFFFGGTDYDEYYMRDIEYTIEILQQVLLEKVVNEKGREYYPADFSYTSSW